ncbi:MAG TPA: RIP metalloprotease RseP, partial [Aliiroseovarius sp.]|nr:RIP metalloprotease RseP [Aliiroseovarius sp.]
MDLIGFVPQFGSFALTILAFVTALTVIVFIHEYGHYIIGRWTGIKADVFSIGIGPTLWSRMDKYGTRWQVAAFPVGGYVKFRGDANAASAGVDGEAMQGLSEAEKRATMPGAPIWARALTVAAGPVFNFVLSIGIFAGFAMYQGVATDPLTVANLPQMPGLERSLQPGDRILEINGVKTPALEDFGDFVDTLPATSPLEYRVDRDGVDLVVEAPHPFPALVSGISPGSAAMEAGLQAGDLILAINGIEVPTFDSMRQIVGDGDGAPLVLDLIRDGQPMTVTLTPRKVDLPTRDGGFETRWLIGITGGFLFEPATRPAGVVESLKAGASQTKYIVTASLSGLYHMVAG